MIPLTPQLRGNFFILNHYTMSNYKSYSDRLKDPKWQRKRLEILNRDNFTCQLCKDGKETLHVHHFRYADSRDPWDVDNEDLITYCWICHLLVETLIPDEKPILLSKAPQSDNSVTLFLVVEYLGKRYMGIYRYEPVNKTIVHQVSVSEQKVNLFIEMFTQTSEDKKVTPMVK